MTRILSTDLPFVRILDQGTSKDDWYATTFEWSRCSRIVASRIWFNDEILEEDIEMLAILKVTNAAKFDSISFVSRDNIAR